MSAAFGFLCGELYRLPKRLCRLLPLLLLLAAASLAALAAVSAGAGQKESVLRLALVDKDGPGLAIRMTLPIGGPRHE